MKRLILIGAIVLTGCDSLTGSSKDFTRFETACSEALKKRLKAPSTFELVKTTDVSKPIDFDLDLIKARLKEFDARKSYSLLSYEQLERANLTAKLARLNAAEDGDSYIQLSIIIEYDSQNSYGALLRGTSRCEYESWNGAFSDSKTYNDVLIDGQEYTDWLIGKIKPK